MANKEHVLKHEGKSSTSGDEVWTVPNGHDVHFALNPKTGYHGANTAVEFHRPSKEFVPHKHPISGEILIIHSGKGGCYLYDGWIPVETRDTVSTPPSVLHGTRNPAENIEGLATLSIATPPQLDLYLYAGYDILEGNSGEYAEGV